MSLEYINRAYSLSAKVGQRVRYTGSKEPQMGTIKGADGQYLRIVLDGDRRPMPFHPTWELELLDEQAAES